MTTRYSVPGENAERRPGTPCYLAPPLKTAWSAAFGHVPLSLGFIDSGLIVVEDESGGCVAKKASSGENVWRHERGTVFFLDDDSAYVWSSADHLEVLECQTGRSRRGIVVPAPAIGTSLVYEGLLLGERLNCICAFDEKSGASLWEYSPGQNERPTGLYCIADETLILGSRHRRLSERSAEVVSVALKTGSEVWRADISDLSWREEGKERSGAVQGNVSRWKDIVIAVVEKHYVLALRIRDGKRVWAWQLPEMAIWQGYLYGDQYCVIGGFGSYHVLDAATGRVLLERDLRETLPKTLKLSTPHAPILVSETHLFTGSLGACVMAFDRKTGEYSWSHAANGGGSTSFGGAYFMSVNGRLYYGDMAFRMYCLEEENPTDPTSKEQRRTS
jgi:outer membrane protein assembly factor BamB